VCKNDVGYYVGRGVSNRATCRGCFKAFQKEEIRLKSVARLGSEYPLLAEVSFCIDSECVTKAVNRYAEEVRFQDG
jgi:hypothetical protein